MKEIKNVLVTGSNGQLGNEFRLLATDYSQFVFFFTDVAELDITDGRAVEAFVEANEIDCIINCAAYTAVDKAEENAALCDLLNHRAPGYLAKAIALRNGSFIHVSTDYVFDGTAHIPYKETDPTCPVSVYGRTKLEGEKAATDACEQVMVIRTAWLYSTFGANFVKTMLRLGRERENLGVVFDQIGSPTYARDLALVIMKALVDGIVPGTYHFSNEGIISWYDFTKAIHRIAGITSCKVLPLHTDDYPSAAPRPHYSVLDKTKIKDTYKMEIPYWEESLRDCIIKLEKKIDIYG